ncbi:hypothetical protein N7481_007899 [Penicillium waksmanii]|uniref:uncharacterized protein n=1 Tax=Penicillium waksmanii TaxID=69791 RepID=UPI0025477BF4|nr:uncharacterized protein N7481_007899 [Penicillium waksmanii]KAJ5980601.1 hypothetical protein N7481_007899 [Penicillium waksmanii]
MAPSRIPLASGTSFIQITLNGSFIKGSPTVTSPKLDKAARVSKKSPPSKPKSKAKSTRPEASDRVLTDVLMAIRPVHLGNIISQQKNHEYRKYRLRDGVRRLWFYETSDGGQGQASITHIAVIPPTTRHEPGSVPTEPFGIGNEEFNAGLKQSKYGYPVLEVHELVRPVTLTEMKDRWGMGPPHGLAVCRAKYVGGQMG